MKRGECRRSVKLAAMALELLFMTLCAVCIGIVSCNAVISVSSWKSERNMNYYISPFSKTVAFQDSDVFKDMFRDNVKDVIRYCVIRGQMETNGVFDEAKEIDIEQYARHFEEMPVTETSVTYRLGDLLKWGQSQDGISVSEYTYEEAERMIWEAHDNSEAVNIALTIDEGGAEIAWEQVEDADVVVLEVEKERLYEASEEERAVYVPVERYLPSDGRSLLAHVESVDELERMMDYLATTIRMLDNNYTSYKAYRDYYDKEESNFKYCVLIEGDGRRDIYSNVVGKETDVQSIEDSFSALGRYVCFSPADFLYESNIPIEEEEVREIWNQYLYAYPDNTTVWAGIDTLFPYEDEFRSAELSYRMAAPGYLYILAGLVCGIMALIVLAVLTYMAGRKAGYDGIQLIRFDRWYTEFFVVAAVVTVSVLFVMTVVCVSELYWMSDSHTQMLTGLAVGTVFTGGAFLFFYFSFVRRIKAGIFWKRFLICAIILKLKKMMMGIYDDSRNVVRVWIPYLIFVAVNLALLHLDYDFYDPGFGSFLAIILDVLVGAFLYANNKVRKKILEGIENIRGGDLDYQIDVRKMHGDNRFLAEAVNSIGNGIRQAVETSMKDERMKADLITNVSHDIKTPLTSIINYVDLIKREPIEDEKIKNYLTILDSKSQRLKQLTEDLVEASKITSGNIELQCDRLNLVELMNQAVGEFVERFEERGLHFIVSMEEEPLLIYADSRRVWRVVENLFNNVYKYAMEHTRVYLETKKIPEEKGPGQVRLSVKNISDQPLNINAEDLTERFIRGDVSRTTEGSGLGLSIAKNLTELQKGKFEIFSDGDLFKVVITFSLVDETVT